MDPTTRTDPSLSTGLTTSGRHSGNDSGDRRAGLHAVVLVATQLVVASLQRVRIAGDDGVRVEAVKTLAAGHIPKIKYSLLHPLVATLPYKLANRLGQPEHAFHWFGLVAYAAWAFVMFRLLRRRNSPQFVLRFFVLCFGSMFLPYLLGFNTEVITTLAVSGGLLLLLEGNRFEKGLGVAVTVFGVANTPALVVPFAVALAFLAWRTKRWWLFGCAPLSVAAIILESSLRSGKLAFSSYALADEGAVSPLMPWGYVKGFGHPVVFGVIAILFSFGRGLVFFVPTLFSGWPSKPVAAGSTTKAWVEAQFVLVGALVVFYSGWWAWYGGVTFGPRFFLIGTVAGAASIALLFEDRVSRARARAIVVSVMLSAWVALVGALFYVTPKTLAMCTENKFLNEPLCWYSPEYSTLFAPLWDATRDHIGVYQVVLAVYLVITTAAFSWPLLRHH